MTSTHFCQKWLSMSLLTSTPHSSRNRRRWASETRVVSVTPGHMAITLTPVLSKWYGNWNKQQFWTFCVNDDVILICNSEDFLKLISLKSSLTISHTILKLTISSNFIKAAKLLHIWAWCCSFNSMSFASWGRMYTHQTSPFFVYVQTVFAKSFNYYVAINIRDRSSKS